MTASLLALFALAALAPLVSRALRDRAGAVLALGPLAVFFGYAFLAPAAGGSVEEAHPLVPRLGLAFALRLDGLSLLFARLVTGIGALVLLYAGAYLKGDARLPRFYASILFFMGSMLGLVLADDAVLLFVFWELTSVSSFLLIGYAHEELKARKAALQALLVTGAGGLLLMAGLLLLGSSAGSFRLSEIAARGEAVRSSALYLPILLLVLSGAFTKSAQVPFHFWLPAAMAAPTPVSAYLHSATMVKAGVYLLARLNPALGATSEWHTLVTAAGLATFVTGALISVAQSDLKRILAFSTVSALGLLTALLGIGSEEAVKAAMVFLLVHALYKAGLFLVAGTIDHEAGTREVALLGGLARAMPLNAAAGLACALSMAGLPPMLGFIAKEIVYEAKLAAPAAPWVVTAAGFLGSVIVVAAAGLVGVKPFFGPRTEAARAAHEGPLGLWLGPLTLAGLGTLFGLFPGRIATPLVEGAVSAVRGEHTEVKLALWHGINPVLLMSVATLLAGALVYAFRARLLRALAPLRGLAGLGPTRAYERGLEGLLALARGVTHALQGGVLGVYLIWTIGATVLLAGYALLTRARPAPGAWGELRAHEAGVALLILAGVVAVLRARSRLLAVAALGVVGYGVALVFLYFGGPDLAMTQFAVETLSVIVFVLAVRGFPPIRRLSPPAERVRDAAVAIAGGALVSGLVLAATGVAKDRTYSDWLAGAAVPLANGRNVVNVILVDFRGLDTLGEITVLAVAAIGVVALLKLRAPGRAA
jgi:multicomponent Na+:H+ antiporter subunit A